MSEGFGNGFTFTAPADTTLRTLIVHVGGWASGGRLVAHLSDGSAVDYTDTTPLDSGQFDRNYTLSYRAEWSGTNLAGDLDDGGRQRECDAERSGAERFDGERARGSGECRSSTA